MASSKDDKLHWHTSFDVNSFASKEIKFVGYEKFVDNSIIKILNKKNNEKNLYYNPCS